MKKLFYFLCICLTSVVILFSCSDGEESHLLTSESLENWNEIGQLHNEGLEKFYDRLVESDIEINESTTDQVFEILDDIINDYYPTIQDGLNPPHYPITKETHDMIVGIHTNEEIKLLDDPNSEFLYTTIEEMGANNELVENVRSLMNIYDNTENWESYDLMESALENFKEELSKKGEWNNVLDDGYNIAKATFYYWFNEGEKWNNTFAPDRAQARDFIGNGRADIGGGIVGAIIGDGPGAIANAMRSTAISIIWDLCCN